MLDTKMQLIIHILILIGIPYFIVRFQNSKPVSSIGTVGFSYAMGLFLAICMNILEAKGILLDNNSSASEIMAYIGIAFAIPFLLFANDWNSVRFLSRRIFKAFFVYLLSLIIVLVAVYFTMGKSMEHGTELTGMSAGLYIGGTPNLNAIAYFFDLDSTTILYANLSDLLFGGLFYIFLIFLAKPLLGRWLACEPSQDVGLEMNPHEMNSVHFQWREKGTIRNLIVVVAIIALSVFCSAILWLIKVKETTLVDLLVPGLMIGTTIGGLVLSKKKTITAVKNNAIFADYFISLFSFSIASILRLNQLSKLPLRIFIYFALITVGAFFLHAILCKVFGIDCNIMIVTATACIYGPAFVPSVCRKIDGDNLLKAGLVIGSFGYCIASFVGIFVTFVFRLI